MRNLIYDTDLEEMHSFDSYFGPIVDENGVITIPYVNLGISEHPLNKEKKLRYINKAYIVFEGVVFFEENYSLEKAKNMQTLFFGGYDVNLKKGREFKIVCNKAYLKVLKDSKLSDEMWIAIKTPSFMPNMKKDEVEDFLKCSCS